MFETFQSQLYNNLTAPFESSRLWLIIIIIIIIKIIIIIIIISLPSFWFLALLDADEANKSLSLDTDRSCSNPMPSMSFGSTTCANRPLSTLPIHVNHWLLTKSYFRLLYHNHLLSKYHAYWNFISWWLSKIRVFNLCWNILL